MAPDYLSKLLTKYTAARCLRSQTQSLLVAPRTRLKTKGGGAFQSVAPRLWNSLPLQLRLVDSVESFEKQLKTLLFKQAFC